MCVASLYLGRFGVRPENTMTLDVIMACLPKIQLIKAKWFSDTIGMTNVNRGMYAQIL